MRRATTCCRLAEATGEDLNPLITLDDGTTIPLDTLETIVHKPEATLMEALGHRPHVGR